MARHGRHGRTIVVMAGHDPRLKTLAWQRLRLLILDRDGWQCQVHGSMCTHHASVVDHITARADGGDCWDPANLRAACVQCNSRGGSTRTNARTHAQATRWGYRPGGLADPDTRF
jgi:5-methylcytosine-specific restriction endonuclease McrA